MNRRSVLVSGAVVALLPRAARAQADACAGATPVAAYDPTALAWEFRGEGYRVSDPVELRDGLTYLTARLDGDTRASVEVRSYPDGYWVPGLDIGGRVGSGGFVGTVATRLDAGRYVVAVESSGGWRILVEQPR